MTLDETLAAIEAVESKATKGKWLPEEDPGDMEVGMPPTYHVGANNHAESICFCNRVNIDENEKNHNFIAHSRNILPSLLRLVRRQAEEIAYWTRWVDVPETPHPGPAIRANTDLATADLVKAWEGGK